MECITQTRYYNHTHIVTPCHMNGILSFVHAVLSIVLNCTGNMPLTLNIYSHIVYNFNWLLILTLWPS